VLAQAGPAVSFWAVDTQRRAIRGRRSRWQPRCVAALLLRNAHARTGAGLGRRARDILFYIARVRHERVADGGPRKYACSASEHNLMPHGFKPDLNLLSGPEICYQICFFFHSSIITGLRRE
jgi:hypothetical protein